MLQVKKGDIVAAKFPHDDSWYRGQVCGYEPNEDDPSQSLVTVYYVDFGDTETIKMDCVFELRTDYLKLNFQAIECFLANIKTEWVLWLFLIVITTSELNFVKLSKHSTLLCVWCK